VNAEQQQQNTSSIRHKNKKQTTIPSVIMKIKRYIEFIIIILLTITPHAGTWVYEKWPNFVANKVLAPGIYSSKKDQQIYYSEKDQPIDYSQNDQPISGEFLKANTRVDFVRFELLSWKMDMIDCWSIQGMFRATETLTFRHQPKQWVTVLTYSNIAYDHTFRFTPEFGRYNDVRFTEQLKHVEWVNVKPEERVSFEKFWTQQYNKSMLDSCFERHHQGRNYEEMIQCLDETTEPYQAGPRVLERRDFERGLKPAKKEYSLEHQDSQGKKTDSPDETSDIKKHKEEEKNQLRKIYAQLEENNSKLKTENITLKKEQITKAAKLNDENQAYAALERTMQTQKEQREKKTQEFAETNEQEITIINGLEKKYAIVAWITFILSIALTLCVIYIKTHASVSSADDDHTIEDDMNDTVKTEEQSESTTTTQDENIYVYTMGSHTCEMMKEHHFRPTSDSKSQPTWSPTTSTGINTKSSKSNDDDRNNASTRNEVKSNDEDRNNRSTRSNTSTKFVPSLSAILTNTSTQSVPSLAVSSTWLSSDL